MKWLIPIVLILAAACGGSSDNDDDDAQGLQITAEFEAPPQAGRNVLLVEIRDEVGQPVASASVTVDPQMPSHGHGSTEDPVVTEIANGLYRAEPVTFQMPGPWVVGIHAESEGRTGFLALEVDVE